MKRRTFISLMSVMAAAGALSLAGCSSSKSASSAAANKLETVQSNGKLVVALEGAWQPWSFHDESDTLVGYDVEVSRAIAEKLGVEPEYVESDWDSLFAGLDAGRYDLVCNGVEVTEERAKTYDFTTPYGYIHTALAVRKDNEDIKSFEDLAGKTTANSLSKGNGIGLLDVSEFGASSVYIDQRTGLQDEIAEKIADIFDAGFQFIYFDGSEGVNPPFGINVGLAQYRVFRKLNPQPIFAEGAAKSHFSWHMLSGGNAFDIFPPEVIKAETRKWPAEEAPRMRQDFTRINFGWLGYYVPDATTIGTQPDMWEYVTSLAAAWDSPVSIWGFLGSFKAHARTADNLEVIRRWEEVRKSHWLTDEQKKTLQNADQEHHLLINEQNRFELIPYDQVRNVAGGSSEIRAFVFERQKTYYAVYWHISGDKKLELQLNPSDITLYEKLGAEKPVLDAAEGRVVIPAGSRHYIKANGLSKERFLKALETAQIVE